MDPRQAIEQKAKAELDLLEIRLDGMQARAQKAKAQAEIGHQQQMAQLMAKCKGAREYLSRLNHAQKVAWENSRLGPDK